MVFPIGEKFEWLQWRERARGNSNETKFSEKNLNEMNLIETNLIETNLIEAN